MNNTQNTHNRSRDKVLDWIIIIAALVLFPKTADLLSYFAPSNMAYILGMDVSWLYGMVSASLVEGALLALHFNPRARIHTPAKIVMWLLVGMSGAAQILDGFIATGNEANMSEPLKFALQFGVPLVPLIVLIMIVAVGDFPDIGNTAPRVGLKHRLPDWNRIWHGDDAPAGQKERANHQEKTDDDAELEARPKRSK
jgi:hypothetical protein